MKHRVVITGRSLICPLGDRLDRVMEALRQGQSGVRRMDDWDRFDQLNTRLAAPAPCGLPDLPRKKIRGMGRVALLAVSTAIRALEEAGLTDSPVLSGGRCGVAFGSSSGNVDSLLEFFSMLTGQAGPAMNATTYIRAMPQTCAVNISVFFAMQGRLVTTNTACTAGSLSIGQAFELIQAGTQDVMLAGGADELSPTHSAVFDTLYATSTKNDDPSHNPRPFDRDRDGLVVGEGSGCLVLESLDHALGRGAPILGELVGFGTNTDGDHITQPNPATMAQALRLALESAGLGPSDIDFVNGHGTATEHGDIAESQATREVFGRRIPFHSLKGHLGHTLGACGAVETILALEMMRQSWFAPSLNLHNLDPRCADLDYITGPGRPMAACRVMCNNFAFGGINTSLILQAFQG